MAKRFLDKLAGDAYEEDVLVDLIPTKRKPAPKKRKSFLGKIEENIQSTNPKKTKSSKATRKKSFLDTIEEALDNNAFDDVIPVNKNWNRRKGKETIKVESRFSTMITTEVLERARFIAEKKGIRIKDVINIALQRYIEQVGD